MTEQKFQIGDAVLWRKGSSYAWAKNPWLPAKVIGLSKQRVRIEVEGRPNPILCMAENLKRASD